MRRRLRIASAYLRRRARRKRIWKIVRRTILAFFLLGIGLWIAAQVDPRVGPFLADGARKVFGPGAVAWAEDVTYGMQDRWKRFRYGDAPPKTYWTPPVESAAPPVVLLSDAGADGGPVVAFPPPPFAPPFAKVAAKGDGQWIPIGDDVAPGEPVVMAKALVHPDEKRPYAAVAVVAIDLTRTTIRSIAGTEEPASEKVKRDRRPGKVPESDHARLVATFNGGWQAIHGHFGMMVEGAELLPPKDTSCTLALYKDESAKIAPWAAISAELSSMRSYRQTPPCLVEDGKKSKLLSEGSKNFGAAVDGATIIRRSGAGIDKARNVLFYASGDSLSVLSLADALAAAGAADVAELDVNWAFPRFLFYVHKKAVPEVREALIPATFKPTEHTGSSYYRDYFYVTRR